MNQMVTASEKTMKRIFSRKKFENINHSEMWPEITNFEEQIYRYNKVEEIQKFINTSKDCVLNDKIELLSLSDFLIKNEMENYLPVPVTEEEYLFLVWDKNTRDDLVIISYTILQECFSNQMVLFDSKLLKKRWEKLFSLVPVPIVIFDEEGELIIHNSEFSKLDLGYKKCEDIAHEDQITIKKSVYRVLRRSVDDRYHEFLFIPVDEFIIGNSATSSEELGIISSSIAHEINNPLAGILAAIDFLTIDDVSEEVKTELLEMKGGILRCKKLISTFLGFSQLQTQISPGQEISCLLKESIDQSLDLIRFRLIENNIQVQIEHKGEGEYSYNLNPHVFSMIFYLILGDIVTNVSHHSLVIRKSHNKIPLIVNEKNDGLEISLPGRIELSSNFLNSKLMGHLLDITHMRSTTVPGKLSLIRTS